jgi:hypothetical protein
VFDYIVSISLYDIQKKWNLGGRPRYTQGKGGRKRNMNKISIVVMIESRRDGSRTSTKGDNV